MITLSSAEDFIVKRQYRSSILLEIFVYSTNESKFPIVHELTLMLNGIRSPTLKRTGFSSYRIDKIIGEKQKKYLRKYLAEVIYAV
jgi:hypothetical protein